MSSTTTTAPPAHCAYCPVTIPQPRAASPDCDFCAIAEGTGPADVVRRWDDMNVMAIRPKGGGVVDGHLLVIPYAHVADAGVDPLVSGLTMAAAAELAGELDAFNIITSKGRPATQSQFHLHIHIVPRKEGDGLALPWSPPPALTIKVFPQARDWNVSLLLGGSVKERA